MNAITWFEIPALDFDRAVTFYSTVLDVEIKKADFMGLPNGFFPMNDTDVSGAIVQGKDYAPSLSGAVLYLNAETVEKLEQVLDRVPSSGGTVLTPKTDIGEPGFIGMIQDTEGNRIGLHAPR